MILFSKLHKAAFIQVIQRVLYSYNIKAVQKVWCLPLQIGKFIQNITITVEKLHMLNIMIERFWLI